MYKKVFIFSDPLLDVLEKFEFFMEKKDSTEVTYNQYITEKGKTRTIKEKETIPYKAYLYIKDDLIDRGFKEEITLDQSFK